jgi:hypothetical protein
LKQKFLFVLDYITLSFFNSPARLDFSAGTKSSAWTKSWRSAAPLRGWMDQSRIAFFIKKADASATQVQISTPALRTSASQRTGLRPGECVHPQSGTAFFVSAPRVKGGVVRNDSFFENSRKIKNFSEKSKFF